MPEPRRFIFGAPSGRGPGGSTQSTTRVPFTPDLDARLPDDHVEGEPLVVLRQGLVDVPDAVEAPGHLELEVVAVALLGVVDLDLEAPGRPVLLLEARVEVDAGVRAVPRAHVHGQLEVLEGGLAVGPDVEEVRARAVAGDRPVHDLEGAGGLGRLPAGERLAVEEGDPARLVGESEGGGASQRQSEGGQRESGRRREVGFIGSPSLSFRGRRSGRRPRNPPVARPVHASASAVAEERGAEAVELRGDRHDVARHREVDGEDVRQLPALLLAQAGAGQQEVARVDDRGVRGFGASASSRSSG